MAGQHQIWEYNTSNGVAKAFTGDGYERNLNGSRYFSRPHETLNECHQSQISIPRTKSPLCEASRLLYKLPSFTRPHTRSPLEVNSDFQQPWFVVAPGLGDLFLSSRLQDVLFWQWFLTMLELQVSFPACASSSWIRFISLFIGEHELSFLQDWSKDVVLNEGKWLPTLLSISFS